MNTGVSKRTEADLLEMLRVRHMRPGNGGAGEYAFLAHVRNGAGFNSNRTFDAIAMSLWPSRGLRLHAFEIKCSRADWLRELKDPAKAEAAAQYCDQFSLVVADEKIVKGHELPPTWGMLAVRGNRLVSLREAPLLPEADITRPIPRAFLVALLRSAGAATERSPAEITAAHNAGYQRGMEKGKAAAEHLQEQVQQLRDVIAVFERESGVKITGQRWSGGHDPATVGAYLRAILKGDDAAERAHGTFTRVAKELRDAADWLEKRSAGGVGT